MSNIPLAERMRPQHLSEIVGQQHLIGSGAVLARAVEGGRMPSMILWGPPGVGKTTLARAIANDLKRPYVQLSAINSGVKDIRDAIEKARNQRFFDSPRPILFIDEIHRFSKSQQDSLLGAVENGTISLIGATTENPSFEVIPALLSRCQVYVLEHLTKEQLISLLERALEKDEELSKRQVTLKETDAMLRYSGGDARRLMNVLELVAESQEDPVEVTNDLVTSVVHKNMALYDKGGEQHYDIISAFIKSIRGSDPNAAVYWLARMLEGGEDIKFIARRLIILAAEDIGLANPNALLIANACAQSIQYVGMPEARIILSEAAIYLAVSPKSNSAYAAIEAGMKEVRDSGMVPVPLSLRNAPTKLMKELNYGDGYQYAHNYSGNFVAHDFLPQELSNPKFYEPGANQAEEKYAEILRRYWGDKYGY